MKCHRRRCATCSAAPMCCSNCCLLICTICSALLCLSRRSSCALDPARKLRSASPLVDRSPSSALLYFDCKVYITPAAVSLKVHCRYAQVRAAQAAAAHSLRACPSGASVATWDSSRGPDLGRGSLTRHTCPSATADPAAVQHGLPCPHPKRPARQRAGGRGHAAGEPAGRPGLRAQQAGLGVVRLDGWGAAPVPFLWLGRNQPVLLPRAG